MNKPRRLDMLVDDTHKFDSEWWAETVPEAERGQWRDCVEDIHDPGKSPPPADLPHDSEKALLRALRGHHKSSRNAVTDVSVLLNWYYPQSSFPCRVSKLDLEVSEGVAFLAQAWAPFGEVAWAGKSSKSERSSKLNEVMRRLFVEGYPSLEFGSDAQRRQRLSDTSCAFSRTTTWTGRTSETGSSGTSTGLGVPRQTIVSVRVPRWPSDDSGTGRLPRVRREGPHCRSREQARRSP